MASGGRHRMARSGVAVRLAAPAEASMMPVKRPALRRASIAPAPADVAPSPAPMTAMRAGWNRRSGRNRAGTAAVDCRVSAGDIAC
jgi:hypothetical protein